MEEPNTAGMAVVQLAEAKTTSIKRRRDADVADGGEVVKVRRQCNLKENPGHRKNVVGRRAQYVRGKSCCVYDKIRNAHHPFLLNEGKVSKRLSKRLEDRDDDNGSQIRPVFFL